MADRLRLFRGDDEERADAAADASQAREPLCDQMPRFGDQTYYVFPSYGTEFQEMTKWEESWQRSVPGRHRFWAGFSGGGVLALPRLFKSEKDARFLPSAPIWYSGDPPHGMVLGNDAGMELARRVLRLNPERPPALAVRFGAPRVPNPTVDATAEHATCLSRERFLLIVPKEGRKSLKLLERLPEWLGAFGVKSLSEPASPPPLLRDEIHDWFGNPSRTMFAVPIEEGVENVAWQLAVTYYIAEYWGTHAKGLNGIHFVANIEGQPNFRKNWTSNK
jgi:hypothetical protein